MLHHGITSQSSPLLCLQAALLTQHGRFYLAVPRADSCSLLYPAVFLVL